MTKAKPSFTKYIISGKFEANGIIEASDLIGSFFSQTEGILGEELELSNMQKSGKLGRIEVECFNNKTKSSGKFKIPTSIDKINVSLLAATIESIEKIGHCQGKIEILNILDARVELREKIYEKAEKFLQNLEKILPPSKDISNLIQTKHKKKTILKYKNKEIFYTNKIFSNDEIFLVEGRADVVNLVLNGFENVISFNGSKIEREIIQLIKNKNKICLLDDDRGGKLELEALKNLSLCDFYQFAPNGKEIEDLSLKEIQSCIKNKIKINKPQINKKEKNILNEKNEKDISNFSKIELNKIEKFIKDIKDSGTFIILSDKFRKIKTGKILEFEKVKKTSGKILILDGVCQGTILKKSENLKINNIFCNKKSSVLKTSSIKINLFEKYIKKI